MSTAARKKAGASTDTFEWLLDLGLWPVPLWPRGATMPNRKEPSDGKPPWGAKWGLVRCTRERWDEAVRRLGNPGVGICLGPGRGPDGTWLIDVEGDGPKAEESLAKLLGGELLETLGWSSTRGGHTVLIAEVEKLKAILPGLVAHEIRGIASPGVYKHPDLPDLELRIGGFKPDGSVKQAQSACPPTPGTDGKARRWNGVVDLAMAPDAFYEVLSSLASPKQAAVKSAPAPRPSHASPDQSADDRWAQAALVSEAEKLSGAAAGGRNDALNASTFALGQLVPRYLARSTVEVALRAEAERIGLDPGEIEATIKSGIEAGMAQPRVRPERKQDGQTRVGEPHAPDAEGDRGGDQPVGVAVEDDLPRFGNYHWGKGDPSGEDSKGKPVPHNIRRIDADRAALTDGWPKRVGERLFVASDRLQPVYLNSASRLFSWLDDRSHVDWSKGARFVTQERYFEHLRMQAAEQFDAIEVLPHVPPLPRTYYMHPQLPAPSGRLDELLDRFLPLTPPDRSLIAAMILTPLWGGPPGARPAFLITGPDHDTDQGRGLGKTTLLDMVANLVFGGAITVSPNGEMADVITRILSPGAEPKRIARLDNVKSFRFSWSELEDLITAQTISGHGMYLGEVDRRNGLVWVITLNGASLAKDLAKRVVTIKLARPPEVSKEDEEDWQKETIKFIEEHRWSLIADAAAILSRPHGPLRPSTRWKTWERDVLSKLPMSDYAQAAMVERQGAVDEGNFERDIVRDFIADAISEQGYSPDAISLFITSQDMAIMVSNATRKHYETCLATTYVKGLSIPELAKKDKTKHKGWVWTGVSCEAIETIAFAYKGESAYVKRSNRP